MAGRRNAIYRIHHPSETGMKMWMRRCFDENFPNMLQSRIFDLGRDKFTHVSRGFVFVHFHSVDDATNGTTLEKNKQFLRVEHAKSILALGESG
ncbi:hypothetical protein NC652_015540 [Populus alba x Populus x berolinensis]|nr:hypothetical protein NC652_015540 [Populus alba x Populus x berolinensis]